MISDSYLLVHQCIDIQQAQAPSRYLPHQSHKPIKGSIISLFTSKFMINMHQLIHLVLIMRYQMQGNHNKITSFRIRKTWNPIANTIYHAWKAQLVSIFNWQICLVFRLNNKSKSSHNAIWLRFSIFQSQVFQETGYQIDGFNGTMNNL